MEGTDDPLRNTILLAQRAADRNRELPDPERARVTPAQGRQVLRIDLEHRDVVIRAGADHAGIVLLGPVTQDDLELPGVFDDMVIGHDVPVRADDEAGADPVLLLLKEQVGRRDGGLDLNHGFPILVGDVDHR